MELCKVLLLFSLCVVFCQCEDEKSTSSGSSPTSTVSAASSTSSTVSPASTTVTTSTAPDSTTQTTASITTTTTSSTTTTTTTTTPKQKKVITIKGRGFQKKIVFDTGCVRSCYGQKPGSYPSCSGCNKVVICKPYLKKIFRCYYGNKWDDRLKQCRHYSSTCRETITKTPRRHRYFSYGWK